MRALPLFCLTLVAMLTLALGAAGAAHRVPSAESLALRAYALAGLPTDLCGGAGDSHHESALPHCPVCTQIGPAILPDPASGIAAIEAQAQAAVYLPMRRYGLEHGRDPTTPLRGPPLSA